MSESISPKPQHYPEQPGELYNEEEKSYHLAKNPPKPKDADRFVPVTGYPWPLYKLVSEVEAIRLQKRARLDAKRGKSAAPKGASESKTSDLEAAMFGTRTLVKKG